MVPEHLAQACVQALRCVVRARPRAYRAPRPTGAWSARSCTARPGRTRERRISGPAFPASCAARRWRSRRRRRRRRPALGSGPSAPTTPSTSPSAPCTTRRCARRYGISVRRGRVRARSRRRRGRGATRRPRRARPQPPKPGRPAPERPSLPGHVALGALGHDPTEELAQGGGVAVAADLPQTVFKASKRGYLPADTSVQWTHFSSEHL